MAKIRILIVDDHALLRAGLRALLTTQSDFEVVGEASDGVTVVSQCQRLEPDVTLLDLSMPGRGGIGAIHDVLSACPGTKILVVTMHDDETYVRQVMHAGASGYVLKKALAAELLNAIRTVNRGKQYITPTLAAAISESERRTSKPQPTANGLTPLTSREREVLTLVALGHTNVEVSQRLCISEKTVESHRKNIATKLGSNTRADLVRFALEYRLIGM
jgi:two-component system, NarL family, response regulator NreC